jgi:predicted transcriptional regulator
VRQLGDLEAAVMARLWATTEPLTVRQVLEDLNADPSRDRRLAYTTVMTVLDNLHRKGVLDREPAGRAYRYTAARSREDYTADLIAAFLADAQDRTAPLLRFVERLTPAELRRLRAALDAPAGRGRAAPHRTRRRRTGETP